MMLDEYAIAVLGPETDSAHFATQNFIALGGDSLRAMRLVALAQEHRGVRISMTSLLGDAPLGRVLADAAPVPALVDPAPVAAADADRGDAVSHAQLGMWLIERLTGGSPYNLVFLGFVERGELDAELFARAARATIARHDALRTVFQERAGGVVRVVGTDDTPQISVVECAGSAADFEDAEFEDAEFEDADFEDQVRAIAAEHGRQPFDLAAAPAVRFLRVTGAAGSAGRQAVVLIAHHLVLDGWAVGLLLTELLAHYRALAAGATDPVSGPGTSGRALAQFEDAVRASGEWERQTEFWTGQLADVPSVLALPADRQRPHLQDASGARSVLAFSAADTTAIMAAARRLGITPFAFLLGAFGLTLSRWTGARRLLVGVPLSGRGTAELAELVAVAGNLVPVRIDVDDEASAADFLRAVHGSLARSIDAGALPFDELVARLGVERSLGCHPLVQVCFGMHDQLVPEHLDAGALRMRIEEAHGGGAQFDLSLLIARSRPALSGHLEYASSVWGPAEVAGFVADFTAAAGQLAAAVRPVAAGGVLADIRCFGPERRALLDEVNATRREFPATTIDDLFRAVARRVPDAVALRAGATELSYAQLARGAAEQARRLRAAGVGPGDTVLVGLVRSVAEVVALLGVVWAGAGYVGVDLSLPTAHTDQIIATAQPAAALVAPHAVEDLAARGVVCVATWEPSWSDAAVSSADGPFAPIQPDRLAYVAFTSGSTGAPKGVMVPHRAVVRLVHDADYVRLGPDERVLRLSPLAFDASTLEIWGPLLTGAAMEIFPAQLPSPTELGAFLAERQVTVAWLTAGLFRLVEEFAPDSLHGMRQLLTGGDVVPHEHVARMLARNPGLTITNGYGPTENTTFTTTHSVTRPEEVDGPLPIGIPVPGTRVYVLDEHQRLVPPGAVGELYTGGEGLALGYLRDEVETGRGFGYFSPDVPERLYRTGDLVRLDTAGRLRFLGRRDEQVKLRGYRVELSAITDAVRAQPRVRDAVVVVTEGDSAGKRLLAAVVPVAGADLAPATLRDLLAQRLPVYMVPTLWAVVEAIPVTANGKVDRRALAAVAGPAGQPLRVPQPPPPAPVDDLVDRLRALFAESIDDQARAVDADTDFFTVGGNSLGAVRLVRLVKERFGVTLRLRDFLLSPTPAGLRLLIEKAGPVEPAATGLVSPAGHP